MYCINTQHLPTLRFAFATMPDHPVQEDLLSLLQTSVTAVNPLSDQRGDLLLRAQNSADQAQALPEDLVESVWRADQLGQGRNRAVPTGFADLDAQIPEHGWPCGCLIEILQPQPSLLEWRLIGPSLRRLVMGGRSVVVIAPPKRPHLPGLRHLGVEEAQLIWIRAEAPSERLWCTEQLVRSNSAAAVLTWLPQARPEQLRRLQVLAQHCEGPVFVFRPVQARHDPSPAPLRLLARSLVDWQLDVQILKRRGPALGASLRLNSIPGGIDHVLTARTRRPSALAPKENRLVVGRSAHLDPSHTAREVLQRVASH